MVFPIAGGGECRRWAGAVGREAGGGGDGVGGVIKGLRGRLVVVEEGLGSRTGGRMRRGKGRNGLLPNSLRIISSCLKTVSSNAGSVASTVRSAGASMAASIAVPAEDEKDQVTLLWRKLVHPVLWAGFDKLELGPSSFKHVLLLGYSNGFQVLDVEDASNVCELVSKRDGPVTCLQIQPFPARSEGSEGFRASQPLLLVVAGDETNGSGMVQGGRLSALIRESTGEPQSGNSVPTPTVVRFYSLKSHNYVHVLRFRSAVYIVRCSPRIVAVALAAQIYCFDAVTLENKFSVLTYPLQGASGINIGYGPMAVGPRWLAYASNNPLLSNTGRLSPQNLTPSPGVSPSSSPSSGNLVARYAVESSKQLAAGILNLGDMGYKTFSRYCQELLPDGSSSPLSSNSRRVGRLPSTMHHSEADNAGMVVVKDFITKEVISQFRAHTSPISALCFDPSGTLLVTASVHGHNINVFRIMPACRPNASGSGHYDWTLSHVHLYKLYRGLTTAVIQDICFSHYSQWIAIVSSRGTCHIFVLSPFGGDASLQLQNPHSDGPILTPHLTLPWWSTSLCTTDQQFHPPPPPPPPPVTLSVVSRIKNGSSGWLNTVSNVAASASGKISIPSGAIAAVFHNSVHHDSLPITSKANSLEHLLVYSPSGHVIQHELLPSSAESFVGSSRVGSGSLLQLQDEELHVNAEPVQWWDVCRRSNWPEREENILRIVFNNHQNAETIMDTSDCEDEETLCSMSSANSIAGKESVKSHERPNWYLSNAEVQISCGSIPIWQTSKVCFYVMDPSRASGRSFEDGTSGEVEIEKLAIHEVEIRRKDLLPVFEQFHYSQSDWSDRGLAGGRSETSLSETDQDRDKLTNGTIVSRSKPSSIAYGSDIGKGCITIISLHYWQLGSSEPGILHSLENVIPPESTQSSTSMVHCEVDESVGSMSVSSQIWQIPRKLVDKDCTSFNSKCSNGYSLMDGSIVNGLSTTVSSLSCAGRPVIGDSRSSNTALTNQFSNACITNIHSEQSETSSSHNSLEFTQFFHEGYCKVSELDDCCELTGAVTDADSSSNHCEREKPEEDGDNNDDMLGGVFAFSEEG
ncbi:autophagy-related protein 18g isoform X2 [Elaeis guineensis]|uniref:Autophagy-related protein 18g isoform X2 n=1 Tax=Elaeis guineensis var. tenera TaxID=51953 RepID=A0A8N4F580_ELAGV|nr:autophagy-related protein 18g isoform X2 [Elaeis guineensis]